MRPCTAQPSSMLWVKTVCDNSAWDWSTTALKKRWHRSTTTASHQLIPAHIHLQEVYILSRKSNLHFRIFPALEPCLLCARRFLTDRGNIWLIGHHLHPPAKICANLTLWAFLKIYSHTTTAGPVNQLGQPKSFFSSSTAPSTAIFTQPLGLKSWHICQKLRIRCRESLSSRKESNYPISHRDWSEIWDFTLLDIGDDQKGFVKM